MLPPTPLAVCPRRRVPPAAGPPPTRGWRRRTSWMHRLLPGGGLCGALPVVLARLAWERWGCASLGAVPLGPASGIGGRRCPLGVGVVETSMASVHVLVEDDPPCCGRWRAAVAPGAARVPCLLVPLWRVTLHPWGVRGVSVPPQGERSEGASVRAGGGIDPGWPPLVASWGVVACCLPGGVRDLLGPWSPAA